MKRIDFIGILTLLLVVVLIAGCGSGSDTIAYNNADPGQGLGNAGIGGDDVISPDEGVSGEPGGSLLGKTWGPAAEIDNSVSGNVQKPNVAVDPEGNAVVVWKQTDNGLGNVWANRYSVEAGWGEPEIIDSPDASSFDPQITVDGYGNAFAAWYQFDVGKVNVWSSRFDIESGWGDPEKIGDIEAGNAFRPQIAADDLGNALAVWYQHDGGAFSLYANSYTNGTGWGEAELIETGDEGDAYYPALAMDKNGTATVVWKQRDGSYFNVWANSYDPETGWNDAVPIGDGTGSAYDPKVAMSQNGEVVAVWYQNDGVTYSIYANNYSPGTGWDKATIIDNSPYGMAISPEVGIDHAGNAIVVWSQMDDSLFNAWAVRYDASFGWEEPMLLESDDRGDVDYVHVAFDGQGNAIVLWQQYDGQNDHSYTVMYSALDGWSEASVLNDDPTMECCIPNSYRPHIDINESGLAVIVVYQYCSMERCFCITAIRNV